MDDLIGNLSKNILEVAMQRVLYRFEFSALEENGVGVKCSVEMKNAASQGIIQAPCGLVIITRTKQSPNTAIGCLNASVRALSNSGLLPTERIRQFHFDKISSFEETCEIFIIALNE